MERGRVGRQFDRLRVVLDGGGRVVGFRVGAPAQRIDFRVARLEGDGAAEVLDRLVPALDRHLGFRSAPVGGAEAGVDGYRSAKVPDRRMRAIGRQMAAPPSAERSSAAGRQRHGLAVVGNRPVGLAELHVGAGAVAEGGGVTRCEHQRAVEILDRLPRGAEHEQQIATIVVGGGILRIELDRPVEILQRFLVLLVARIGDAAVVHDGRPAVVGKCLLLERLRIKGDRLPGIPAHQGSTRFAQAQQARFGLRRCRQRRQQRQRECHEEPSGHAIPIHSRATDASANRL